MPNTRVPVIQQRLNGDAESICIKCFHRNVCRGIDNQPCIECNQFTDANGVTVQEWISVKDRLPEKGGSYLVFSSKSKTVFTAHYWLGDRWANRANGQFITHWMPLPEPPKGE